MPDEKPKISRSEVLGKEYPLREAYNPKGITQARGKQPPSENNTNAGN